MKKCRVRLRTKLIVAAVIACAVALAAVFFNNATSVILSVSSAELRAMNTRAVSAAVEEASAGISYEDIVSVTYDGEGDVAAISSNTPVINGIARRTAVLTQTGLEELASGGMSIPLGAFTGIDALSGYGGSVNVKIIPVASAECSFVSRFVQAGINQTLHSVYIEVVTTITIVLAARSENFYAAAEVLVCESIINGKVPQIYLQGGLLSPGALVPSG